MLSRIDIVLPTHPLIYSYTPLYTWLALPASFTCTAIPAILSFWLGHSFSPHEYLFTAHGCMGPYFSTVLLLLIAPYLLPLKYVSTALGTHKSVHPIWTDLFESYLTSLPSLNHVDQPLCRPLLDWSQILDLKDPWGLYVDVFKWNNE